MAGLNVRSVPPLLRKCRIILLACFWFAGLVSGIYLFDKAGADAAQLLEEAVYHSPSGLLFVFCLLLPLMISFAAACWNQPVVCFGIAFWKACFLGFYILASWQAYGSGGWLMHVLLFFGDSCVCVVLYVFWLRCFSDETSLSGVGLFGYASWIILIGSVDYCYISPLLGQILE